MRVVDTSMWIEWFLHGETDKRLSKEFPKRAECIVPTIVQLELSKWLTREAGEEIADQVLAYTQMSVVVPLDTRIALVAAEQHRKHRLATADAIIYATALEQHASLLTCDAHFANLPNVIFVNKTSWESD